VTNLVATESTCLHVVLSACCDEVIVKIGAKSWSEFGRFEVVATVVNSTARCTADACGNSWNTFSFIAGKTEAMNIMIHAVTTTAFIRHRFNLFTITVGNTVDFLADTGVD